jgi:GMP synthase (glutamine-hydrolysing)
MHERILILDFGSQYTQLIGRRIRELQVYSEIIPWHAFSDVPPDVKGVVLSGSPHSVREADAPMPDLSGLLGRVPVLGICYGAQLLAQTHGGRVAASNSREYGRAHLMTLHDTDPLLEGMQEGSQVWMSHGDTIEELGPEFEPICGTHDVANAGFRDRKRPVWGIQFHPEVWHSVEGPKLLHNFVRGICGCRGDWTPASFIEETVGALREKLGDDHVILGLSGGVDSTVAAELLRRAIGDRLHCIFVDNGLLRKDEFAAVLDNYVHMGLNVRGVEAGEKFLGALKGLTDPEAKRKAIGRVFIEVFDEASHAVEGARWLGQGTIYPDVIESVSATGGPSATIKSHHNVGGLPDYMKLQVVEPLRLLFKDEVRRVGRALDIRADLLGRHPFPGPGLGIRILGEVTAEKVRILQEVDAIWIAGLRKEGLYDEVWQAGAIFLPVRSVGVMGDERTYENAVALRAVTSTDGMTADFSHLPMDFLGRVSNEIINKVRGVNRVVYDISSKPPATIEWE